MNPDYFKKQILNKLLEGQEIQTAIESITEELLEFAQANALYLLVENIETGEWQTILQKQGEQFFSSKMLLSHTALNRAIESQSPLLLQMLGAESIAHSESIVSSNLQSIAAIPFFYQKKAFACLFFSSIDSKNPIRERVLELSPVLFPYFLSLYLEKRQKTSEIISLTKSNDSPIILSKKSPLHEILNKLSKIAPSDLSVLIRGETGTGKELLARETHLKSNRKQGPFVSLNVTAIPSTLLESTLFGHKKGAFTGAVQTQEGKFQKAHGGTLFLDEIGDLSFELQTKLLRVLQEKEVEMVGATDSVKVDFRLITATHQNLEQLVREGKFREDLYYRLNGISLTLPPLRERIEDILVLSQFFLKDTKCVLSEEAEKELLKYSWPGNIRELEHMLKRASLLCSNSKIEPIDLEFPIQAPSLSSTFTPEDLLSRKNQATYETVTRALAKANGNRAQAAKFLGVSERTLYRMLSKWTDTVSAGCGSSGSDSEGSSL